jgi:choline dehydrogenase-like flavoprotein
LAAEAKIFLGFPRARRRSIYRQVFGKRMHAIGGAIMGSEPRSSVTNSHGQTHDVVNLFVAGDSLCSNSAAVNPIFTLHAVTLRTAGYMLDSWSSLS